MSENPRSSLPRPLPPAISPEQLAELGRAKERGQKLWRATRVATTDAWITAVFAAGTVLTSCMGVDQLAIGIALTWVAFNSFRGARGLKRFDRKAPARLALNQVLLALCIIVYASYQIWILAHGKSQLVSTIIGDANYGDLGSMGKSIEDLRPMIVMALYAVYLLLIVGTLVGQGLAARYYHSRLKIMDDYLARTPPWVVELQKAQAG